MQTEIKSSPVLSRGNTFPFRIELTRHNGTTNRIEGATGLTVVGFIAATKGGTAIASPTTTATLAEYSGDPGAYRAELTGTIVNALLDLNLAAYWACYRISGETMDIWVKITVEEYRTGR